ncbi:MAG: tRNA pseudouridine(38-40) synthase TruA [Bacteroidales bacterium]|nr:tRNA pseudouridine(38-40) synthase TruA [Bacteroidales bacterium]
MDHNYNRYFLKLAYKGTRYNGWQIQKNAPSVQAAINNALSAIFKTEINVVGCGRTDTGVHAKKFYAHFDLVKSFTTTEKNNIIRKLNGYLPSDISINSILPVTAEAHARFDAIFRTYQYFILRKKDPFYKEYSYYVYGDLDMDLMNRGADILFEYQDFTSFSKVKTQVKTNICKLKHARWEQKDHLLVFTITADRFLRNMVRAIVGTLLDIGRGKNSLSDLRIIIENKNRSDAGYSVPARGLFLTEVEYPAEVFL